MKFTGLQSVSTTKSNMGLYILISQQEAIQDLIDICIFTAAQSSNAQLAEPSHHNRRSAPVAQISNSSDSPSYTARVILIANYTQSKRKKLDDSMEHTVESHPPPESERQRVINCRDGAAASCKRVDATALIGDDNDRDHSQHFPAAPATMIAMLTQAKRALCRSPLSTTEDGYARRQRTKRY